MPICGFNEKMREGLKAFHEGLVEYGLKFRSEKNSETIDQAIKREISDMTRLLAELSKMEDSPKRILTEGLVKLAMGFFLIMRRENVDDYKDVVGRIDEFFYAMDNKYYSELEGKPDDMEELVEFLNKKRV